MNATFLITISYLCPSESICGFNCFFQGYDLFRREGFFMGSVVIDAGCKQAGMIWGEFLNGRSPNIQRTVRMGWFGLKIEFKAF